MRKLSPKDLDRLVRSHRNLRTSLLVVIALLIVALVLLIMADISFPVGLGVGLGVAIGALLLVPQRRLLAELGLSREEAKAILEAERERRTGVAALAPSERARREQVRATVCTVAGLVLVGVLLVCAYYFFSRAGRTVEEGEDFDVWFAVSFFAGFVSLVTAPSLLMRAARHRREAATWR